jgi:hypothetical protein
VFSIYVTQWQANRRVQGVVEFPIKYHERWSEHLTAHHNSSDHNDITPNLRCKYGILF